ncbi:putative ABC transport system permease protein [Stackebrandtia endophytica]|uniref:Putative ABC transport system permease protein n=2 Tax=Stackebrandtia endophytica TaxID=1496996 RepID=A0A543AR43_9ACTN|nr:putative ABC transport system permease protein [Stackebrandtia endophytica]
MLRATFKSLMSRKARLLLSGIAVILGATFISGALVLNSSLGKTVESMFSTVYDTVDIQVSPAEQNPFGGPSPVPAEVVDQVGDVDGVAEATGLVQDGSGIIRIVGKNGKVIPAFGAPVIGINWTPIEDPAELREGREPLADDEVVVNQALLNATGYKVGEELPLITVNSEVTEFTIVGSVGYSGGRDSIAGEQSIMFTLDAARANLMTEPDAFTVIDVKTEDGTDLTEVRDAIAAQLGDQYQVQTGEDLAAEQTEMFSALLSVFNYLLLGFGAVALIVSVFLIINTFSIIVAQRTRELALFRAMGAGRGQITGSVLLEAFIIGLLSGLLGLAFGIGLGYLGTVAMSSSAGESMTAELAVPMSAVLAAMGVGIGVTMLAALLPAINASRVPPIAALREASSTVRPVKLFAILGGLLLALGGTGLVLSLTEQLGGGDDRILSTFASLGVIFIGAIVFTPVVAKPLVSLIGAIMSWSMPGKLGRRNSSRNPRRTAITASALMIGITLVTAVGVLFSSAQASIAKFFENTMSADILITGTQTGQAIPTYDIELTDEVRRLDGVDQVASIYIEELTIDGREYYVQATDNLAGLTDMQGDTVASGQVTEFGADDIALYQGTADNLGLEVGDTVSVTFSGGDSPQTLTVSAVIESAAGGNGMFLSNEQADNFANPRPLQTMVQLDDGADKERVIEEINMIFDDSPEIAAADIGVLTDQLTMIFDVMLMVVQILLGVAMLIAVIGVVNTLTLSVLERTRELGLLRAIGMSRGQVTGMVIVESIVISVFGALLGLAIGAGLGIAAQQVLKDDMLDVLAMPWGTMVGYLVAAVVIGTVAALIPAFRANRLNVLDAISYE